MSYGKNSILRYINNPPKIIFWEVGEALTFILPFAFAALLRKALMGVIVGIVFFQIYKYIKSRVSSPIAHALYWYIPTLRNKFKIHIPSYIREYIG